MNYPAGHLGVTVDDEIQSYLKPNTVIIDFTQAEASLSYLRAAAKKKVPMVIATTGFSGAQQVEDQTAGAAHTDLALG